MIRIYYRIYVSAWILLLMAIVVTSALDLQSPAYTTASRFVFLVLAVGYVPLLVIQVHEGSVIVPPQRVCRREHPVMFWVAVLANAFILATLIVWLSGYLLFGGGD